MSLTAIAAKAIIIHNGKILFVQQNYKGKVYWDLPGGKMKFGEDPRETLRREVFEEVNLHVKDEQLIGTWQFKTDFGQVLCITYICNILSGTVNLLHNPGDHIEQFKWIEKEDFLQNKYLVIDKSLKDLIAILK